MVTGNVPFDGKDPSANVLHKHLKAELVPPGPRQPKLSAGISEVIRMIDDGQDLRRQHKNCKDPLMDLQGPSAKKKCPCSRYRRHPAAVKTFPALVDTDSAASAAVVRGRQLRHGAAPIRQLLVGPIAASW